MNIEIVTVIILGILEVVLFFLVFIRDQEVSKRFKLYEKVIEDLNRENHKISKKIEEISKENTVLEIDDIKTEIENEVKKSLTPMVDAIKEIENIMLNFQDEQIDRIDALEERKKEVNFVAPNIMESNEKLIISQYKEGKSEAMIAKDLRIGIGEVDLILKLANLK